MNPTIYSINTPRLLLRCYHRNDAEELNELIITNLQHLRKFMPWANSDVWIVQDRFDFINRWIFDFEHNNEYIFAIIERTTNKLIGSTGLHKRVGDSGLEIGYWIDKDHCNQGIATESSAALTKVALEHYKMDRVEIHCSAENIASSKVPQKLGFELEATLKRRNRTVDGYADTLIFTLFKDQYPNVLTPKIDIRCFDEIGNQYF